jgi:hypothetical protein
MYIQNKQLVRCYDCLNGNIVDRKQGSPLTSACSVKNGRKYVALTKRVCELHIYRKAS